MWWVSSIDSRIVTQGRQQFLYKSSISNERLQGQVSRFSVQTYRSIVDMHIYNRRLIVKKQTRC